MDRQTSRCRKERNSYVKRDKKKPRQEGGKGRDTEGRDI